MSKNLFSVNNGKITSNDLPISDNKKSTKKTDSNYYKRIYNDELAKQKQIRNQIDSDFYNQGVQTNTGYFSTQRNILPTQQQTEITRNKKFEVYNNPLQKNKEIENVFQTIKKSDEYKAKQKELTEQSNKVGYAKYDYDKSVVDNDKIGWFDKTLGTVVGGAKSIFDISGGLVNENGNTYYLPNQTELKQEKTQKSYDTKIGKLLGSAGYEMGKIGASTLMNQVLPGTGTGLYWSKMFIDGTNSAMQEGYDSGSAIAYGAVNTGFEYLTGKLLGSATKGLTGGKSSGYEELLNKVFNKILNKPKLANVLANAGSEATEEFIQEYLDNLSKIAILKKSKNIKDYTSVFTNKDVLSDAIYSALVGAITGGTIGTLTGEDTNVDNENVYEILTSELEDTKKDTDDKETINAIDNLIQSINDAKNGNININDSQASELESLITEYEEYEELKNQNKITQEQEQRMIELQQQITQLQSQISENNANQNNNPTRIPTVNDIVNREATQKGNNPILPVGENINGNVVADNSTNLPIGDSIKASFNSEILPTRELTFLESAKANGINPDLKPIQDIDRMFKLRGIKASFSPLNTTQYGLYKTSTDIDGNRIRQVVLNPVAGNKQLIQETAVHELYHDLFSGRNATDMNKLIRTFNERYDDFAKARQALADAYARVYPEMDRNSAEFNAIIDEEVAANILARKLGNQEYINRLVHEEPSLARRIYNFVIDKLNKLNGLVGYKNERLFWEDIKNKFDKAYREEYKRANNMSDTRFSIQTDEAGNKYVEIDTDQDIFEGINPKDYNKIAKMYINDYLKGETTLAQNDKVIIDSKSANKYTNPGKKVPNFQEKMRLTPELKNVLEIAKKDSEKAPTKPNSKYPKWEYYDFDFKLGGVGFNGTVNIGIDSNGNKHFYEVSNIKRTSGISETSPNRPTGSSANNIPQNDNNVKSDISTEYSIQENQNNTPELDNSSFSSAKKDYRGSHQIENANKITDLDLNEIKEKVIEANGGLSKQDYSDLSKLKKILNSPNEMVKIYRASPINELNDGDWVTTDKSYAKNVAEQNGGKVYEYEVKADQLFYPDDVKSLPSLHRLSSFRYNDSVSNSSEIQGMNVTKSQVEDAVYEKFDEMSSEYGFDVDEIMGVYLHGSRLRGTANPDSDLDAVVFYIGNESEDYIFNTINDDNNQLVIDGVKVDINPVSIDSLSEMDEYIERSEEYDKEVINRQSNSDDTRYSQETAEFDKYIDKHFQTDNQGRKLSKNQQRYFKNSKARDENGNLVTVYHTMTNEDYQFNEFNPVGTEYYRFGDQVVNYYTDSKDMSGSYAGQKYKMADTKVPKTIEEVKKMIIDHNNSLNPKEEYDYRAELIKEDGTYKLKLSNQNGDILTKRKYENKLDLFKNIKEDLANNRTVRNKNGMALSRKANFQYEGYVNITNPYIVDAEKRNWNQVVSQSNDFIDELDERVPEDIKNNLTRLYRQSEEKSADLRAKYNILERFVKGTDEYLKTNKNTAPMKKVLDRLGTDRVNLIVSGNDAGLGVDTYYGLAEVLQEYKVIGKETAKIIIDDFKIPDEVKKWLNTNYNKKLETKDLYPEVNLVEKVLEKKSVSLKELYEKSNAAYEEFDKYRMPESYFLEQISSENSSYLDNDLEDMFETRAEIYGAEVVGNEIAQAASVGFSKPEMIRLWGTSKTTNDVVKEIIASNKDGNTDYDGVIIKNVYDYGGKSAIGTKANNLYVTFNSNQFKAVDNLNPTEDADIRYSQENSRWERYLDKHYKREGTGQTINEVKLPIGDTVKASIDMPNQEEPEESERIPIEKSKLKKVMNPNEISKLTLEDANTTPILPTRKVETGKGESKFASNIEKKTNMLSDSSKSSILSSKEVNYYKQVANEESLEKAFDRINDGGQSETFNWLKKDSSNATSVDVAEGWILLKQYQDAAQKETDTIKKDELNRSMVEVAKKMREIGTKAGQTVQAFNILNRLTPEGMVYYAQSELSEAYDKMVKNKTREWIDENREKFVLTPEETQFIMDNMEEIRDMDDGYDKRVKLAEIQKLMTDKLPPEKGAKVKSWMRISMLFNPKTQVRNVAGNAFIAPINYFGDMFSSYADKIIAKKTGVRTTGNMNVKAILKGLKQGAYEATNDYRKGINTKDMEGNRFEISEGKSFSDKNAIGRALNRTESLLNYVMDVGDRVFSQASFENSLQNQMVLNNTTEITQDMIDIARAESLQRTWNDNNAYTSFVLNVRKGLNKLNINGYGLGDILIPFAKTPANLTKAIVDYSPLGLVKAISEGNTLKRSLTNGQYTSQMQHKFVQDLGKATAGTMLYILGYALAKAKITSGKSDDDKDVANFLKNTLGISSYSIKIGNKSFTYDWAQPLAAPLSIMSNIATSNNKGQALMEGIVGSLDTAGAILLEQSFLQSINDVLTDNEGFVSGLVNSILDLPARAVPTFSKQIADMIDGTQRTSFEYDKPLETAVNKIKAKIPFVSRTLAPVVDTMGRDIQKYGGKNNIFNVFLNPANVNTENVSNSAKEIYRLYKSTGETDIMPRVAPYYVNSNGEKISMTSDQRAKYQKVSGNIIEKSIKELLTDSKYKNMNDTEKADIINKIVSYSYNKAKEEVLNVPMSDAYNKVNMYTKDNGTVADYYLNKEEIDYSYKSPDKYKLITQITDYDKYLNYQNKIDEVKKTYTNTSQRKNAVINYVNSLELSIPQKAMLIKMNYSSFDSYNSQIIDYINSQKLSVDEKSQILTKLGFKVKDGRVY